MTPWKIQLSMRNDPLMCEMRQMQGSAAPYHAAVEGGTGPHESQDWTPTTLEEIMRTIILGAQLLNNSCWCWANAGLLCTLWALLSRPSFAMGPFCTD